MSRRPIARHALVALCAALVPPAAIAQGPVPGDSAPIRPEDRARLEALDAATGAAMRQLLGQGSDAEVAAGVAALRGTAAPAEALGDPSSLAGDWSCRMTKLGGISPAITYPPFRCHIGADEGVLQFEKLTGSQRTRGTIRRDGDRWVYLGSTFVAGEQPRDYADFPAAIDIMATETLPDVGLFEITGPGRARIVFPQPYRESLVNVLTLTR